MAYEACLAHELRARGFHVLTRLPLPVECGGVRIEIGYRVDLLVDGAVVVELQAVAKLRPRFEEDVLKDNATICSATLGALRRRKEESNKSRRDQCE